MKLKQSLTIVFLSAGLLQAGFFDHDKEYYDKHPKEAKSKVDLCDKAVVTALKEGDMKLAEKYDKDDECLAAKKSLDEYKEKKRKEELLKKKAAFEKAYKEYLSKFEPMNYSSFMNAKKEACNNAGFFDDNAKCKAWEDLKKEKIKAEIDRIIKENPKDKLFEYKKNVCKDYFSDKCHLADKAVDKATEERIKFYLAHKDLLKKDYNECYHKIYDLDMKSKYEEKSKVSFSYKCTTAGRAAGRVGSGESIFLHPFKETK